MKKYIPILFLYVFLCFNKDIKAQELPIYSQYMFNDYLINSAYAGTYDFTPIIINHRNQWMGFGESTPKTSSISAHSRLGKKSAIGSSIILDKTSPISRTQIEASYGYHVIIGKRQKLILSMALSGTLNMLQFSFEENTTYSELTNGLMDNINQGNENSSQGDINFGMVLFNDYFDLGINIKNLMSSEPSSSSPNENIQRVKYIILHGSYLGRNNPESPIGIIPSFVIRKMGLISYNSLFELDLNLKIIYRNKIWTGLAYRTHEKTLCTLIGFNTGKLFFGWSYDIGASSLGAYHNGSHNIAIGYNIGEKKHKIRNQNPFQLNIDNDWKKIKLPIRGHKTGI